MASDLQGIYAFYASFDMAAVAKLRDIYSDDIEFVDPVKGLRGVDALQHYFRALLTNVSYCRFDITHTIVQQQHVSLTWTMYFAHPKLARGSELTLDGTSQMRLVDNKIVFQRDYYDMGAMLYEHLPLMGKLIRWLKARLD